MMMVPLKLSEHLTVSEFTGTSHRELIGEQERVWNGTAEIRDTAQHFAETVFEPVRQYLGSLHVNSGFRCQALNDIVGGRPNSRHMLGLAADVVPVTMDLHEAFERASRLMLGPLSSIDQIIIECNRWLHIQGVAMGMVPRHMALTTQDGKTFATV